MPYHRLWHCCLLAEAPTSHAILNYNFFLSFLTASTASGVREWTWAAGASSSTVHILDNMCRSYGRLEAGHAWCRQKSQHLPYQSRRRGGSMAGETGRHLVRTLAITASRAANTKCKCPCLCAQVTAFATASPTAAHAKQRDYSR